MRKSRLKFFIALAITLLIISTSVIGGYFVIDKVLVPKYFSGYGINNLKELVNIVQTIYIVPDEKDFITNPYTDFDADTATKKLLTAGFPQLSTGEVDYEAIAKSEFAFTPDESFVDNFILLSDKELASIAGDIIDSGILVSNFPDLQYINTLNMELKQIIITPNQETSVTNEKLDNPETNAKSQELKILSTTTDASITMTIKLDTESARKQIAANLNMPMFLVDWIIPDIMYVTCQMDTFIDKTTNERVYHNANLSINSKTPKQSEVLLNLLISFIFPEDTYTIETFANELGALSIEGINLLGVMEFATIKSTTATPLYGIKLYI